MTNAVLLPQIDASKVWGGSVADLTRAASVATGFAALDRQLPGHGWPVAGLVELLTAGENAVCWSLLLPALQLRARQGEGPVVLVAPPHRAGMAALVQRGLAGGGVLHVGAPGARECLWASEQAVRCSQASAVLAWLPQATPAQLRRLHLLAARHESMLFALRPHSERLAQQASPAPLRIVLDMPAHEPTLLRVRILKRRGPPVQHDILLPHHPPALRRAWAVSAGRQPESRWLVAGWGVGVQLGEGVGDGLATAAANDREAADALAGSALAG